MGTERKVVAYRLEPVFEIEAGGIATAAVIRCIATGEILSGMGGGGEHLAPSVVGHLRGGGCIVADAGVIDKLTDTLGHAKNVLFNVSAGSGYCMCGDPIDSHGMGSGHSPVDSDHHMVSGAIEAIDAALSLYHGEAGK